MKSSELATDLLIKHFNGEIVDWQRDYAWDTTNPFIAQPQRRLRMIAEICCEA